MDSSQSVRLSFSGKEVVGLLLSGFQFALSHIGLRKGGGSSSSGSRGANKASMGDDLDQVFFFVEGLSVDASGGKRLGLVMFVRLSQDEFAVVKFPSSTSMRSSTTDTKENPFTPQTLNQIVYCIGDSDVSSILNGVIQSGAPPPSVEFLNPRCGTGSNMLIWSSLWKNRGPTEVQIPQQVSDPGIVSESKKRLEFIRTRPNRGVEIVLDKASATFAIQAIFRPARSAQIASDCARRLWMRFVQIDFDTISEKKDNGESESAQKYRLCIIVCAAVTQEGLGTIQTSDTECSTFYAIRDMETPSNERNRVPKIRLIHSNVPPTELELMINALDGSDCPSGDRMEVMDDEMAILQKTDSVRGDLTTVIDRMCSKYQAKATIVYEGGLCAIEVIQKCCDDYARSQSKSSSTPANLSVFLEPATTQMRLQFEGTYEARQALQYRLGRNYPDPGNEDADDIKESIDAYLKRQARHNRNPTLSLVQTARPPARTQTRSSTKKSKRKLVSRGTRDDALDVSEPSRKTGKREAARPIDF